MRARRLFLVGLGLTIIATHGPVTLSAQVPLGPVGRTGQTLTPAYEGWYPNHDGTLSVSFRYFNRNYDEEMDIPIGPDNVVEPGTGYAHLVQASGAGRCRVQRRFGPGSGRGW